MKAIEQYFHMAFFIMLYKVVLIFEFVDKAPIIQREKLYKMQNIV